MSTLGPAYNEYTGSRLQRVDWVPLTTSRLSLVYNEYTGPCLQWVKKEKRKLLVIWSSRIFEKIHNNIDNTFKFVEK